MKSNTKNKMSSLLNNGSGDLVGQFLSILELPDNKFDVLWETLEPRLRATFSSQKFQQETLQTLSGLSPSSIEEERKAAQEIIDEVKADDTLSQNKKDMIILIIEEVVLALIKLMEVPRERIKVKIQKLSEDAKLPEYAHKIDVGADLFAAEEITLKPHETKIVPTGIAIDVPVGYMVLLFPRSGMSAKTKMRIANSVGVIDPDYHKEVGVIFDNTDNLSYTIKKGDRIGQLVILPSPMIEWEEVEKIEETERGGFGSTGE